MKLNFPLNPNINPLAKMVSFDTGNAQCHENNATRRDTRNKVISERSKRGK
jgi:hypothetical protein